MKSLQLEKPHAVIVIGIRGSGKSFFAKSFAETFHAPYLDQSFILNRAGSSSQAEELYDAYLSQLLLTGRSIVIERTQSTRTERTELTKVLRQNGYTPLFVWVQVDTDTAYARTNKASRLSRDDFDREAKRFSAPHASEKALVISGKHTFATQAKAVLKKLSSPRTVPAASDDRRQPTRGQIIVR